MTFRPNFEAAENVKFTVDTPAAHSLVKKLISGTTSYEHHLDVLWMGAHLAIVKYKTFTPVSYEVVDLHVTRHGDMSVLKALSKGEHVPTAFVEDAKFVREMRGRVAPSLLGGWIHRLQAADAAYGAMKMKLEAEASVQADKEKAEADEIQFARGLFIGEVMRTITMRDHTAPSEALTRTKNALTVAFPEGGITINGDGEVTVMGKITANKFSALVAALRKN